MRNDVTISFYLIGHNRGVVAFSNEKDCTAFLKKIDSDIVTYQIAKGWFTDRDFPYKFAPSYKGPQADFYE